jgi:hypothetical protein
MVEWKSGMRPLGLTDELLAQRFQIDWEAGKRLHPLIMGPYTFRFDSQNAYFRVSLQDQVQSLQERMPSLQYLSHCGPVDGWSADAVAAIRLIEDQPRRFDEAVTRQAEIDRSGREMTDEDLKSYFCKYTAEIENKAAYAIILWNEEFTDVPEKDPEFPKLLVFREFWLPSAKWEELTGQERCDVVFEREATRYVECLESWGLTWDAVHARKMLSFHSWADRCNFTYLENPVECARLGFSHMSFSKWLNHNEIILTVDDDEDYVHWYKMLAAYRVYLEQLDDGPYKDSPYLVHCFDHKRAVIAKELYDSLMPDTTHALQMRFQWAPFQPW